MSEEENLFISHVRAAAKEVGATAEARESFGFIIGVKVERGDRRMAWKWAGILYFPYPTTII